MPEFDIRPIDPDEVRDWLRSEQRSFGIEPEDTRLAELEPSVETPRAFAAFDGNAVVATGGAYSTTLFLPGGHSVPVAGITAIGTRATHRRRGLFRALMDALHQQSAEVGEPAAALLASESSLYPRVGYGLATTAAWVQLDRRRVSFRRDIPFSDRLEMYADVSASGELISDIWERHGARRPGWLARPPGLRDHVLADHQTDRHGAMGWTLVIHRDRAGRADGYCLYRRQLRWEQGQSTGSLFIHELVALADDAHLALWRHCLEIDLVETIEAMPVAIDDPLPDALEDRRQYRTIGVHDQLWLRPHDPARLLQARRYATADTLVVDVEELGRFRVDGSAEGADIETTDATADLTLGRAELASLIIGRSVRPLVAIGRVQLAAAESIDRVDQFFRWPVAPFNLLDF